MGGGHKHSIAIHSFMICKEANTLIQLNLVRRTNMILPLDCAEHYSHNHQNMLMKCNPRALLFLAPPNLQEPDLTPTKPNSFKNQFSYSSSPKTKE